MRYQLSTRNALISPMLVNDMSRGRVDLLPVAPDGTITLPLLAGGTDAGLVLYFSHAPAAGPAPVAPGTVMRVWLTGFFYCQEQAEYEQVIQQVYQLLQRQR